MFSAIIFHKMNPDINFRCRISLSESYYQSVIFALKINNSSNETHGFSFNNVLSITEILRSFLSWYYTLSPLTFRWNPDCYRGCYVPFQQQGLLVLLVIISAINLQLSSLNFIRQIACQHKCNSYGLEETNPDLVLIRDLDVLILNVTSWWTTARWQFCKAWTL